MSIDQDGDEELLQSSGECPPEFYHLDSMRFIHYPDRLQDQPDGSELVCFREKLRVRVHSP